MRLADLAAARVAIWGYGREGRAALAVLRQRFPQKELTVFCSEAEAATIAECINQNPSAASATMGERAQCEGAASDPTVKRARRNCLTPALSADVVAGEGANSLRVLTTPPSEQALRQFDVVIKSPGISPYKPPLPDAEAAGVRFTSGTALWFAEHPQARTICVTGTKGKSTVTALIAHILRKAGQRVALAGNIGMPLLDLIAPTREPDWWVIELSSFQTRDFDGASSVAVINNLYEEHLDWHRTREHYAADKLAIAARARRLVVNAQEVLLAATAAHPARSVFGDAKGWHVADGAIRRGAMSVLSIAALPLRGLHNALNVCAALVAIEAAGFDATVLAQHATTFRALPHRLQLLGRHNGIDYVNDSIATTPYATIEALRSLDDRVVTVLVGGFDRGVDWSAFVDHVALHPPHAIVATGANGERIVEALCVVESPGFTLVSASTLEKVLECARSLTPAGGTILLSPGAPSFDAFCDYAERGREFARLAGFDPAAIAQIEGLGIA